MIPITYNGIEVDMFSLGNADSILVTQWTNSVPVRVLIDGGNSADGEKVLAKLAALNVTRLDHVVCTHPHNDHAAGLVSVLNEATLSVGCFWIHLPWSHIDYQQLDQSLSSARQSKVAGIVRASLEITQELCAIAGRRKIPIREPFDKTVIGPLYVCGPTVEFYSSLLLEFSDLQKLQNYESDLNAYERKLGAESIMALLYESSGADNDGELGAARTEPENDSSVILFASFEQSNLLFTADAGVPALQQVVDRYKLGGLAWMQIPHHGSRRNLTEALIKYFKPTIAFVSAEGSVKHPRRKVVNTFKSVGTSVYSTHHPNGFDLRECFGFVPPRNGALPAVPL